MKQRTRTYEAMFLVDAGKSDFDTASEPIRNILDRSEAEILSIKPWDERRLAYEIRGRRRGLYVLTYFKADPASASEIERHCNLSEDILRVLILRRDDLTEEQINAKTPAEMAAARRERAAQAQAQSAETASKPDAKADAKAEAQAPQPPQQDQPKAQADKASNQDKPNKTPDASPQDQT